MSATASRAWQYSAASSPKLSGMAQANQTPIFAPAAACSAESGVVRIVDGVAISGVRALPIQFTKGLHPVGIRGDRQPGYRRWWGTCAAGAAIPLTPMIYS